MCRCAATLLKCSDDRESKYSSTGGTLRGLGQSNLGRVDVKFSREANIINILRILEFLLKKLINHQNTSCRFIER